MINKRTVERVIKRQYNTIIDEEAKIRRILSMETDDTLASELSVGLLVRVEQHLDIVLSPSSYTEEELMTSCTLVENSIKDFNLSVEIIET